MTGVCEVHGPLLPCTEIVTERGRKDPAKFPVPSFVEIRESNIPGAGQGVFAIKFIEPGQIIGENTETYLTACLVLCFQYWIDLCLAHIRSCSCNFSYRTVLKRNSKSLRGAPPWVFVNVF